MENQKKNIKFVRRPDDYIECRICEKRKAVYLCDMPRHRIWTTIDFKTYTSTCDHAICEKCAIEVGDGIHFCLLCAKSLKNRLSQYKLR